MLSTKCYFIQISKFASLLGQVLIYFLVFSRKIALLVLCKRNILSKSQSRNKHLGTAFLET